MFNDDCLVAVVTLTNLNIQISTWSPTTMNVGTRSYLSFVESIIKYIFFFYVLVKAKVYDTRHKLTWLK